MSTRLRPQKIAEFFYIERDELVREVQLNNGGSYKHRCSFDSFKELAYELDEYPDHITIRELYELFEGKIAWSQIATFRQFLDQFSLIESKNRRYGIRYVEGVGAEDALVEFYALKEANEQAA